MIARSIRTINTVSHNLVNNNKLKYLFHDNSVFGFSVLKSCMIKSNNINPSYSSKMNSIFCNRFGYGFKFSRTKLTKQQIQSSSYDELIDKITKVYNYQQYKIPSALALLQIHHQYKIFKAGDWVLDIGAGPNWSWTDLALKLTHTPNGANKVISNDLHEPTLIKAKSNNLIVTGNFLDEPTRTKIAMNLVQRRLDTILVDATLKYTANEELDSQRTMQVFIKALEFSQHYLKKGGTIVLRTIASSATMQNQMQAKFFFNQVYKFKSSAFRIDSPCCFYIMRGYMMSENFKALQKLIAEYNKATSHYSKTQIVQKYRNKYPWDPVMLLNNYAKNNITKMRAQGKKNKQIVKLYQNDPYIKAAEILSLMDKIQSKETNIIQKIKAQNQLKGFNKQEINLPQNQDQFAQILFKHVEEIDKQQSQKQKSGNKRGRKNSKQKTQQKAKIQNKAPLGQNQIYMKSNTVKTSQQQQESQNFNYREYTEQDLYGFNSKDPFKSINKYKPMSVKQQEAQNHIELEKLIRSFPEVQKKLQQNNTPLEQQVKKFQKQFRKKYFNQQQNTQEEQKNKKKQKPNLEKEQNQQSQHEDDTDDFLFDRPGAKTKASLHHQNRDLNFQRKSQMESEFDFNNMGTQQVKDKFKEKQYQAMFDRELNQMNKVQYLKSKPTKAERPMNKGSKKSSSQSYFKQKKKDKF